MKQASKQQPTPKEKNDKKKKKTNQTKTKMRQNMAKIAALILNNQFLLHRVSRKFTAEFKIVKLLYDTDDYKSERETSMVLILSAR